MEQEEIYGEECELDKCKQDPVYFIEKYCTVNGEHIKLNGFQKGFIRNLLPNYLKEHKTIFLNTKFYV